MTISANYRLRPHAGYADHLRSGSPEPVVHAELPGRQHAFDLFHSFRFSAVVDGVEAFTAWVRSREGTADRGP